MTTLTISRHTSTWLIGGCFLFSLALSAAQAGAEETVLFNGKDLTGWKLRNKDPKVAETWKVVSKVELDPAAKAKLIGSGEGGTADSLLFRQPIAHGCDIITEQSFGDVELHIEFLIPGESNSGIYLMGEYEVQVLSTSPTKPDDQLTPGDCAGIYNTKKADVNAIKPAGEWNVMDIVFRTPRFDADGKKTANAKFISVIFNGKKIHDNAEAPKPTGGQLGPEKATGPLMLQGDHGVVAFRNIRIKPLEAK